MARSGGTCKCRHEVADAVSKYTKIEPALQQELQSIVAKLSAPQKGIFSIDESSSSLDSKFRQIGIENSETNRRNYREIFLSAYKCLLGQFISGIIMDHETLYQKSDDNIDFMQMLQERNVIAGIKVVKGTVSLFGTMNEDTTEGLDSLQERCIQYKKDGCHFAKWRCHYKLSANRPSTLSINENAKVLTRFATIAQSARLVPVIELEILTIGEHEMARALEVHEEVLSALFHAMMEHHVFLEGVILCPTMVLAGVQNTNFCTPQIVADFTLTALRRTVPSAVPAIMFLDDGQSDEDAILNLNAIITAEGKTPWTLSFCYGRTLHDVATTTWKGKTANIGDAVAIFLDRAEQCSKASQGKLELDELKKCMEVPGKTDGEWKEFSSVKDKRMKQRTSQKKR